ncbi:dienelactone hydrolase family protein [Hyalangium rubrum]|uniref:Prolyl oligopeptidase family serine peptidase n=1 Tax=Hyalangium rubrum TaxID=3103134 RepID=A0ABU5HCJ9_9BACT|nr:prolyl oligopeptidase family serine peptidase [Hyalangium sp. s54d21]MDY7231056.1 prolyl oligopeptidase family serine peptidase [Hyalangium sp. s54d21]
MFLSRTTLCFSLLCSMSACGPELAAPDPELSRSQSSVVVDPWPTGQRIAVSIPNGALGYTLDGYLYLPTGTPTDPETPAEDKVPAVVMLHGCAGLFNASGEIKRVFDNASTTASQQGWAQRAMDAGMAVLLVDSLTTRGLSDGSDVTVTRNGTPTTVTITKGICKEGSGYPGDDVLHTLGVEETTQRPQDALAARQFLATVPGIDTNRVGVLGWSHGGSTLMALLAHSNTWTSGSQTLTGPAPLYNGAKPFKVGYAFYPGCGLETRDADNGATDLSAERNYGGLSLTGTVANSTWIPNVPFRLVMGTSDSLLTNCRDRRMVKAKQLALSDASVADAYPSSVRHSFDEAFTTGGSFTQADVDAKVTYDQEALDFLTTHLDP